MDKLNKDQIANLLPHREPMLLIDELTNIQKLKSPFLIQFGLTQQMGIAPAMADWPDTGHHHLLINKPTYEMLEFISKKNGKNIGSFLDSWALQEYDDYQNKPFKKILKR